MKNFVRFLLCGLVVCSLTWLGILWWWQRSGRAVAETDMVVYLGVLPLVTLLLIVALRSAWARAVARAAVAPASMSAGPTSAPAAGAVPAADEQQRHATLRMVHAAVVSTGGNQVADLLQAVADGEPVPVPDKVLVGEAGLPIMCARLPDESLALEICRSRLDALVERIRQEHGPWQAEQPSEVVVRALAALQEPVLSQRQWLLDQAFPPDAAGADPQAKQPCVWLLLGCAPIWTPFEQTLAIRWAESLWAGDDDAMATACVLRTQLVLGTGEDLWLKADQIAHRTPGLEAADWLLLAAAHSDLDQYAIDALSASGLLYDARKSPGGCMPGEAAATVLIAPGEWTAPADLDASPVLVHRPGVGLRSKPVEAAGKVDAQVLREVVGHASAAARLQFDKIAALVCDADQHSPRATELYGVSIGDLPQLDPLEDMRVLGKVTGHTGSASCLMVVACAGEWARKLGKPVLAVGMADSRTRLALIVQPDLPKDAVADDSAANRTS